MSRALVTFRKDRRHFRLTVQYNAKLVAHVQKISWTIEILTAQGTWRAATDLDLNAYGLHEDEAFSVFVQPRPANVQVLA